MIVGITAIRLNSTDQPYLQPRAGETAPPLGPDLDQALGDHRAERQQQDQSRGSAATGRRLGWGPKGGAPVSAR